MPRRVVGYVELEWTCPVCHQRNPGSAKLCQSCGAAQPTDVQFEAPVEQKIITDEQKLEHAKQAPDRHCPYCGARNPADAKICSQCGGDLTQAVGRGAGNVVSSFNSAPQPPITCPSCGSQNPPSATTCHNCGAALNKPRPVANMPAKQERGWGFGLVFIGIGLVMLIAFGFLIFQLTRQESLVGTVQSAQWVRTIDVEGLVPVRSNDWEDELPADAVVESCQRQARGTSSEPTSDSVEVCGTPFTVDKGTGFGEVTQDCWYQVYDNMCSYTVQRWQTVDHLTTRGADFNPIWPQLNLAFNQRIGSRHEEFSCAISANDQTYTYTPHSFDEYQMCEVGQRWQMNVNGFGSVQSLQAVDSSQ